MILDYVLFQLGNAIYALPELTGCLVAYVGEDQSIVVKGPFYAYYGARRIVIIEELKPADQIPVPIIKYNQAFLGNELKGGAFNCAFAAISAIEVLGGAAAEPLSGGLSTAVVYAGYVGLATSGAQCVNSLVRSYVAYAYPLDHGISTWDDNAWYSGIMKLIDFGSLVAGGVSMAGAARDITIFLKVRGSLVLEEGVIYTNQQKIELYKNAIKNVSRNEAAAKEFEALVKSLKGAGTRMLNGNEVMIRQMTPDLAKVISATTLEKLSLSVKTIIVNANSTFVNAMPPNYYGSASGTIYTSIKLMGDSKIGKLVFHIIGS